MPALQFWFEFASTYSYPAAMGVEARATAAGLTVEWRPLLLGPIFQAQGWTDSPFNIYPVKGRYMWRDLERICEKEGLEFARPSRFPRPSLLAARVACVGATAPWGPAFVRAVYRANFVDDREISEPTVIADIVQRLGVVAEAVLTEAQQPDAKARLRANTEEAIALGVFGAPTFSIGSELFWGNDRLEDAIAWATRR
ncbi:MAG: 2-hydroxychromene-2-carboxylate isomerase [Candidatus Binatia bacterium]